MATQERVFTVDDVLRLEQQPMRPAEKYYLINGKLITKIAPTELHGDVATRLAARLFNFVDEHNLGRVLTEVGHHPPHDRRTVLLPDIAFTRVSRMVKRARSSYVPHMPDLAIEVISPSQSLAQARRKADVYLSYGTALVWLVDPVRAFAEVWRRDPDGDCLSERIAGDGHLSGEAIVPGFRLALSDIFDN